MKDKEIKLEEIEDSHTRWGKVVYRGEGSGECTHDNLLSDTLKSNGLVGTDTRPGVWLRNKPTDLSV